MSVIIFLIILAILILVHEFGHFIVAKKSGIRVDEFGLGFPPKIFSKKWGHTLYTLNLLPFGGFVKIFGEDPGVPEEEKAVPDERGVSFQTKSKWIQSAVLVAGVTMNILFAWLLISLGFMIGIPAGRDYSGFGEVQNVQLTITEILPNSPAQKSGLNSGDVILYVGTDQNALQNENLTPENIQTLISESKDDIQILAKRGQAEPQTFFVEPTVQEESGRKIIGIAMDEVGVLKLPVHLALLEGIRTTGLIIEKTVIGLAQFLWDTVRLKSDLSQVTGPVGIANVVGEANSLGFVYLLSLVALISINLAVINLLPFPALDGGRLFFIIIEAITRRKIPPGFVRGANIIGFALLLLLMLVVTAHDILNLI